MMVDGIPNQPFYLYFYIFLPKGQTLGAGAKLLCDFKADPMIPNMFGFDCMDLAFSQGASEVATALWSYASGRHCLLHWAMLCNGGDPDFVSMVVEKGSELNYLNSQFHATSLEARS